MPLPSLMEELIEEFLLRFPPDEPASLFRASLVCKPWCRHISGARFRRRYREFHRRPPLLGFLCGSKDPVETARFVPTPAFRSPLADRRHGRLLDARHGRVLLLRVGAVPVRAGMERVLVVWDPITDDQREIPVPELRSLCTWKAAVVCGAGACDHLDCHRGPFLVILVASCSQEMLIWTYCSDTGSWTDPIFSPKHDNYVDFFFSSVLVGNVLYIASQSMTRVVKYDLGFRELTVVGLPPSTSCFGQHVVLSTTEDGRLGLATIHESKLYMWSTKHGAEADAVWTCDRVIELERLLRVCSNAIRIKPVLVAFVEGVGVILLRLDNALFTVDLKTSKVKKVCDGARIICAVVPYMSFYTPALGAVSTGEGPSADGSSA